MNHHQLNCFQIHATASQVLPSDGVHLELHYELFNSVADCQLEDCVEVCNLCLHTGTLELDSIIVAQIDSLCSI